MDTTQDRDSNEKKGIDYSVGTASLRSETDRKTYYNFSRNGFIVQVSYGCPIKLSSSKGLRNRDSLNSSRKPEEYTARAFSTVAR